MKFYEKSGFFQFLADFAEISVSTPFYPFFKKDFISLKDMCLGVFVHKYHQNRPHRKKAMRSQNLSNKK